MFAKEKFLDVNNKKKTKQTKNSIQSKFKHRCESNLNNHKTTTQYIKYVTKKTEKCYDVWSDELIT